MPRKAYTVVKLREKPRGNKMKTLGNPEEFCQIHKDDKSFLAVETNFQMRSFINSYGFRASREFAEKIMSIRASQ